MNDHGAFACELSWFHVILRTSCSSNITLDEESIKPKAEASFSSDGSLTQNPIFDE
ncbi:hypothetical protein KIN20_009937 [Parelaphostrongylus tenuis]|uniref:Uncharacterized protein n=1 Tax=Parelaphostrongylus tenuis TaxID=148309 RepID=A0AAD5MPV5_PARTN|nr:hypothetical protein KIN20_009937 [Parelaphostrongylus tenuis]